MSAIFPELYTFFICGVFLVLSFYRPNPRRDYMAALALAAIGIGVCVACSRMTGDFASGTYRADLFSQVFKTLLAMGLFLTVCLCERLPGVDPRRHSEFYLLLAACTLAMMLLVSSVHLVPLYVSLELSSYSLYILVYFRSGKQGGMESAMKYFLTGAASSAIMLFGLALIYGATGTAFVGQLMEILPQRMMDPVVVAGLALTLCGFFFKLAVFPFHFWAPDVYEGAPHQVAAYISTVSKVAAIAVLIRLVALAGDGGRLVPILLAVSIGSMTIGNLSAIGQKDLKRLLAFSSVAHAGYVLIGILSLNPNGYAAAAFYALTVVILKFTCFLIVVNAAPDGRNIRITDLAGLHQRAPLLAAALMMALFGLAGIPPTIGFTGKLLLFTAAMERGYLWLIILAMINVVISLYYYIQVLKAAYLMEPEPGLPENHVSLTARILAFVLIGMMIFGGIFPTPFIKIAASLSHMFI